MLTEGEVIGAYTVGPQFYEDQFCSLWHSPPDKPEYWIKEFKDELNALNEPLTLKGLLETPDPRFVPYLPSTPILAPDGVLIFEALRGFYSLSQVIEEHGQLDPRDMAWMYRRLLVALGFAHQAGYAHGAVLPQNVWIHPEKHGLVLTGWAHAAVLDLEEDGPGNAGFVGKYPGFESWYPTDRFVWPGTDIYMAAACAVALLGGDGEDPKSRIDGVPGEYHAFFHGSLTSNQRLNDAWTVLEYFDALLERLYGPRVYREFRMSSKESGS